MAINGYRTIPTDGSGELYSWPGCVVLVSADWSDGPAFAERVAGTDHADAALAFRDLAGWLLARSGDTVADFAAVLQTGSSLLCMAAGNSEVLVGDGRRVVADVSGMWAQLVLAQRPDRLELGVSAGLAPERVNLEHGVVPADGVLLIPGGGEAPGSVTGASNSATTRPAGSGEAPGGDAGSPASSASPSGGASTSGGHPSAAMPQASVSAPDADAPVAQPAAAADLAEAGSADAAAGTVAPAPAGSQRLAAAELPSAAVATSEAAPEGSDAADGDPGSDPRGSPDAGQARHQLPFDAEFGGGGQPTDADGLVGLVSEEPEPSGASGSTTFAAARAAGPGGDAGFEGPEPTGEHLSASTFVENGEHDEAVGPSTADDPAQGGEATGLVPIVTTPSVPGAMVSGSGSAASSTEAPGRGQRASAPPPQDEAWPPPPAWAPAGAKPPANDDDNDEGADDPRSGERRSGDPRLDAPGFDESGFGDDGFGDAGFDGPDPGSAQDDEPWAGDWAVAGDVGAADADLVTGEPSGDDGSDEDHDHEDGGAPKDDTNERDWDSDGLDDDQSIPLLLFDDGVAVELPGDVLIGRRPDPGVRDDPSRLHTLTMTDDSQAVSRNHVELRRRLDEVSIVDCGSANGTFVEATPGELTRLEAEAPHVLRDGERVVFGKRWFEYRAPRQSDSDE